MSEESRAQAVQASHMRICAVIVTYNIGASVEQVIDAALANVEACVVVDNASQDDTRLHLRRIAAGRAGCHIIEHEANNLARAQNIGMQYALREGYDAVLLLDHDSVADAQMVAHLLHGFDAAANVGMVVPRLKERHSVRPASYVRHYKRLWFMRSGFGERTFMDDVMLAIASGSLIPAQVLRDVGWMDESLCIDKVDYDFCLRMIRSGHKIVAVRDALLHHQLGHCHDHRVLGARVTTSNHSAHRRYFIYRNRLRLWRKHGHVMPAYMLFDVCAMAYDLCKIAVFEAHKFAKYRAILAGVRDALIGVEAVRGRRVRRTKKPIYPAV